MRKTTTTPVKQKEPLLKKPLVYRQQNDPDGGYDHFLFPIPMLRHGEGKSIVVGIDHYAANKNDVRFVSDPEQIAKLSSLWEIAEQARMDLEQAATQAFEGAQVFSDEEIDQISELVVHSAKVYRKAHRNIQ
jgi:hypothetical protein